MQLLLPFYVLISYSLYSLLAGAVTLAQNFTDESTWHNFCKFSFFFGVKWSIQYVLLNPLYVTTICCSHVCYSVHVVQVKSKDQDIRIYVLYEGKPLATKGLTNF